jgi:hypothetical protein
MSLPRQQAVGVGLATMGLVWGVYGQIMPSVADLRTGPSGETNATSAEKAARWTSGILVVGIGAITRDATVFIMGGVAVIAFSWLHRHANMVNPSMGSAVLPSSRRVHESTDGVSAGYTPSP